MKRGRRDFFLGGGLFHGYYPLFCVILCTPLVEYVFIFTFHLIVQIVNVVHYSYIATSIYREFGRQTGLF